MADDTYVQYAESRHANARTALLALMEGLPQLPGFLGAELLSSPEQRGLYLLVSRWAGELPTLDLPPETRAWSFVVEAILPW